MSEQFKVGEIATLQNIVGLMSVFNGQDCEVTCGLTEREMPIVKVRLAVYTVDVPGWGKTYVLPEWLKKKRPPQQDDANKVVSWDECAWKPPVTTPA